LVLAEAPDALLTIIGKDPPKELRNPKSEIRNLDVTGYVTDLAPYLQETAVFIVPLHAGGGMRVKILDAWAWGLPIVSTTIGAEGLRVQSGENILLADDAASFARAVVSVLQHRELADHLASAGRATVERAYDWRQVYRAWDEVYA
jgi:glycosyltransferase involved in cell wall biosynthesis